MNFGIVVVIFRCFFGWKNVMIENVFERLQTLEEDIMRRH